MIKDLDITNYRLFQKLKIKSFARVNLIVGDNNSGKSSLLEAIHLLTSDEVRSSLLLILNERGEVATYLDPRNDRIRRTSGQISQIFYDRSIKAGQFAKIMSVGDGKSSLNIILQEIKQTQLPLFGNENEGDLLEGDFANQLIFERNGSSLDGPIERLTINEDGVILDSRFIGRGSFHLKGKSRLLPTNYIGYEELAALWDNITLTPKEDKVVEALQILEPLVDRISFTSHPTSNSGILIRMKGEKEPIPLGSMGDGMRRILALAASLVSVENGTLLVDEIDTGLYHGVLADMWLLVLETASKHNAQVFATTHSWDCVKAFQQALLEFNNPEIGRLIRLEKLDNQVEAVIYSTNELDIAIEQGIEVR